MSKAIGVQRWSAAAEDILPFFVSQSRDPKYRASRLAVVNCRITHFTTALGARGPRAWRDTRSSLRLDLPQAQENPAD
jgi:hypothetical protein